MELESKRLASKMANKHTCMKWDDPILSKITTSPHELTQHLHHATAYDLEYVLLLIGD